MAEYRTDVCQSGLLGSASPSSPVQRTAFGSYGINHTIQSKSFISHHQPICWCPKYPVVPEGLRAFEQCCQSLSNCLLSQLLPWTSVISVTDIYSWSLLLQKPHTWERDGSEAGSSSWRREAHVNPDSEEPGSIYIPLDISILPLREPPNWEDTNRPPRVHQAREKHRTGICRENSTRPLETTYPTHCEEKSSPEVPQGVESFLLREPLCCPECCIQAALPTSSSMSSSPIKVNNIINNVISSRTILSSHLTPSLTRVKRGQAFFLPIVTDSSSQTPHHSPVANLQNESCHALHPSLYQSPWTPGLWSHFS